MTFAKKKYKRMVVTTKESEQQAKLLKQEKFKKRNSSSKKLLSEIISLGGDKTDLDLIRDVLSGSEKEDNDDDDEEERPTPSSEQFKIDEKALEKDLAAFVKMLDIKSLSTKLLLEEDEEDMDEGTASKTSSPKQEEEESSSAVALTKKEKKKLRKERLKEAKELELQKKSTAPAVDLSKISDEFLKDVHLNEEEDPELDIGQEKIPLGKDKEVDVRTMVDEILQGKEPTEKSEWANGLVFESDSNLWYQNSLEELPPVANQDPALVAAMFAKAESLWKADAARYEKSKVDHILKTG